MMYSRQGTTTAVLCIVVAVSAGCANRVAAPIAQKAQVARSEPTIHRHGAKQLPANTSRPASYTVRSGDTLHSIAWRYRVDYRELASWNALTNPNLIIVGQKLRLHPAPKRKPAAGSRKKASTPPTRARSSVARSSGKSARQKSLKWTWPAKGSVKPAASALGTKGIEILGRRGEPVRAAAEGEVVYSGSGLRGYGRLIIVKHNAEYLSAYAHNERLLVAEGSKVKSGERIADMGDSEAKSVMLHFEIRRDGKAVEPLKLLPRR